MLDKFMNFYEKSMPVMAVILIVGAVSYTYLGWLIKRLESPEFMLKTYRNRIRKYGYEGIEKYFVEYAKERAEESLALENPDFGSVDNISSLNRSGQLRFLLDNLKSTVFEVKDLTDNKDIAEATLKFSISEPKEVKGEVVIRMRFIEKTCEWDIIYLGVEVK